MFAQTNGCTTSGLNGVLVTVEVDIANGLPAFDIVGLPDTAVRESRERVRAAIKNSGYEFPSKRITVNLAPADLKKDSSGLDLPIAVGILIACGYLKQEHCQNHLFIGELSLEGRVRSVSGVLPMAVHCRECAIPFMMVASDNCQEALLVEGIVVYAPETLEAVVSHISGKNIIKASEKDRREFIPTDYVEDFADVQGQFAAKRALEIAAAGGHNVLMIGPPGSGKTMLARRVVSIMPYLSDPEALEVTKIYSVAGLLKNDDGLLVRRSFRSPHHTISSAGMIGGGRIPRPGEVTLSHNGVLFLDELPEFPRTVLEVMRQPIEDGAVTISRVNASITYPAKFMLISAMNPCNCGYFGTDSGQECECSDSEVRRYRKKISGPLLDRIDIHVHVPRLKYDEITERKQGESSSDIRQRVTAARLIQQQRLQKYKLFSNSQMSHRHIVTVCRLTESAKALLKQAFDKMNLSARGYDRIIKVSQTISDLAHSEQIDAIHIAEAVHFRNDGKELL